MKYVVILDPGVASREPRGSYPPYDEGLEQDIFIKNASLLPMEGKVSSTSGLSSLIPRSERDIRFSPPPRDVRHSRIILLQVWNRKGGTVFPDFTDPKTTIYWMEMCTNLHKKVPFDGLWLVNFFLSVIVLRWSYRILRIHSFTVAGHERNIEFCQRLSGRLQRSQQHVRLPAVRAERTRRPFKLRNLMHVRQAVRQYSL